MDPFIQNCSQAIPTDLILNGNLLLSLGYNRLINSFGRLVMSVLTVTSSPFFKCCISWRTESVSHEGLQDLICSGKKRKGSLDASFQGILHFYALKFPLTQPQPIYISIRTTDKFSYQDTGAWIGFSCVTDERLLLTHTAHAGVGWIKNARRQHSERFLTAWAAAI